MITNPSGLTNPAESGPTGPQSGLTKPGGEGGGFSAATSPNYPADLPAHYRALLSPRAPQRDWQCLTLIAASCGLGQKVRQLLALAHNIRADSRSLKLTLTRLHTAGLIVAYTLTTRLGPGRVVENLQVAYLTPLGRELCAAANLTCLETDYERLCRLHRGAEFPDHTLALLPFKREAERRGHRVDLCPELYRPTPRAKTSLFRH